MTESDKASQSLPSLPHAFCTTDALLGDKITKMKGLTLVLAASLVSGENSECQGCSDWYGRCRSEGAEWVDDNTWQYACRQGNLVFQEPFCDVAGTKLHVGETFRDRVFRKSCQSWGIAVDGCFFENENKKEVFLPVGSEGRNGLVSHHCEALSERPKRVQYYTRVQRGRHVVAAKGKARNANLPEEDTVNLLSSPPRPWLIAEVSDYIRSDGLFQAKIRYKD